MATARELIIGMMAGSGSGTRLHPLAEKVADEILGKHAQELTDRINAHERVVDSDQFSHQEDAYYAGLSDAADIVLGETFDELE